MDAKDVRIFCEMGFKYYNYTGKSRRPSPKEIGKKLGLDEKTVRSRTRRMEREGFIQYYQAIPNPSLFHLPLLCTVGFRTPGLLAKHEALVKLREAPGIVDIQDFLGETIGVSLAASSDQDSQQKVQGLSDLIGAPSFPFIPPRNFPNTTASPDKLDWQLIKALRYDATRQTKEIAKEIGATYRTVEYRISRLLDSRAFFMRAIVNARDPKGIVFYSVALELQVQSNDEQRVKSELRERYRDQLWWEFSPPGPMIILNMFATSVGEAEDKLLDALGRPRVRGGSISIFKSWIEPAKPSWIDHSIEEKIAAR